MKPPPRSEAETPPDPRRARLRLYNTLTRRKRDLRRSTRRPCACMSADRPSTISPISATRGRSSCSTCCSGCCGNLYGADHVIYVRNITDVDDKINARAARDFPDLPLNAAIAKVTEATERQFHDDVAALGCLPPTPRTARDRKISRR